MPLYKVVFLWNCWGWFAVVLFAMQIVIHEKVDHNVKHFLVYPLCPVIFLAGRFMQTESLKKETDCYLLHHYND